MTEPISDRWLNVARADAGVGYYVAPSTVREIIARLDAAERLSEERRVLLAATLERECVIERECDALTDVLQRHGFVRCDIPACNCGSWHPRYGLTERMGEIKDALHEAGHELCNANGNLTLNALRELIAERDALREALRKFCIKRTSAVIDPPHGLVLCLLCKTISRELDPRRELGHERDEQHAPGCLAAPEKEPNP